MKNSFVAKTVGEIMADIATVKSNGAQFYQLVHDTAVQSLHLVGQTGDWAPAAALMNALPMGTRRNGLALWFKEFSNGKLRFTVDAETKGFRGRLDTDRKVSDFRVDEAALVSFADFSKEPAAKKPLTVEAVLKFLRDTAGNTKKIDGKPAVEESARVMAAKALAAVTGSTVTA